MAEGVRVRLRLTPKAKANRVTGLQLDAEGRAWVKAQVTTVPEGGKANEALIKMLAKEWRVAKSDVRLIQGATDRNKTLLVSGEPDDILNTLKTWSERLKK